MVINTKNDVQLFVLGLAIGGIVVNSHWAKRFRRTVCSYKRHDAAKLELINWMVGNYDHLDEPETRSELDTRIKFLNIVLK